MKRPNEIVALLPEGGILRAARYTPRGREAWARAGGGQWPLVAPQKEVVPTENLEAEAERLLESTPNSALEEVVESDKPLTRALVAARVAMDTRRVVLGLPLSRVLVRILKMPPEVRADLTEAVALQLDKLSPFPGEELAIGCEVLSEDQDNLWVLAAAVPAAIYDELGAALDSANLQVWRTDISVMGWLRTLGASCKLLQPGRRAVLMNPDGVWDLLILDDGVPVMMRSLGAHVTADDIARDILLSLLNAELESGGRELTEVVVVAKEPPTSELTAKLQTVTEATVRHATIPTDDGGVEGVALRSGEGATLDLTPQGWRDAIREAHLRKRLLTGVGIAVAIWVVFMGTLFAGPMVFKQLTARERTASRSHSKAYREVADTRDRVKLIEAYTDRSKSPLEMLRMTSLYMPQGITLIGFTYKREDGIKISGEADQPTMVYDFKDAVTDDEVFEAVNLIGPSLTKGKHKFDIEGKFFNPEEYK